MNPYAAFLGGRDPLAVIPSTAERLGTLVDRIGDRVTVSPAPGKWSARDILCHLADTEIAFAFRLRQALAEEHHVVQPFDQEKWARSYGRADVGAALVVFTVVRRWNTDLLRGLTPEAFQRALTHPERGDMTFRVLVETMAGHDLNHIAQLEAIAAARPAGRTAP